MTSAETTLPPLSAPPSAAPPVPRALFVYLLIYGGMTVVAGVLASKQVQLWPTTLAVEAGIFAFLILVVISSTVAQLYGAAMANRLVWWGFLPLALSTALLLFVLKTLPASAEMVAQRPQVLAAFELIHNQTWRIWLAGPAAYIVSLLLNVLIFARLRGRGADGTQGGTLSLMARGAIASALSQAVDSVIFITLAFYGEFPIGDLLVGQILAKVALSLALVPVLIAGGVALARRLDKAG